MTPLSSAEHRLLAQGRRTLLLALRAAGLRLRLSADFAALAALNQAERASWHALAPSFAPRHGGIGVENGFWLAGHDAEGRIVAAQAARFYDFGNENLADHLTSLRLFYPAPARQAGNGETCQAPPAADTIRGRAVLSGATWVAPAWRGRGLAAILPRLSRLLALQRWQGDTTFSFVSDALLARGMAATYGYHRIAPGMLWRDGGGHALYAGALVWLTRPELLADLRDFCASARLGQHGAERHVGDKANQVVAHRLGHLGHLETIEQGVPGMEHMIDGPE